MMDLAGIRTEIAAALDAVDGLSCTAKYRQVSRPGESVVRFDNVVRDVTGFGFIVTYQALVVLPQDLRAAEAWVDANLDTIVAALAPVLVVGEAAPVNLQLDTGVVPALQITGTRAA
jgi:hypothetical protein